MINKFAFYSSTLFLAWLGASHAFADGSIVIQPVSATGTHTIIGTDIFLPSGPQRVGLEFRVAGWGPQELKTAQARVSAEGFDNGGAPLAPASVSCPSNNSAGHSFCAQTLGAGSKCQIGCPSGSSVGCHCDWGFQSTLREDYVAFGFGNISASDIATSSFRCGMTVNDSSNIPDPGVSLYLGTFYLDIPPGAGGSFDLGITEAETFLRDAGDDVIPIGLQAGARIIIGPAVAPGSRYVAFQPEEPGVQTAVRIELTSIYHPGPPVAVGEDRDFSAREGEVRWLGPPATFSDAAPDSSFVAARLQCTPHFIDWGSIGTVQIYGDAIIPSSVYTVVQVPISCQANPNDPFCFGLSQTVHTGQWGDVAAPFARSDQAAQPDVTDIAVIIDSFRGLVGAAPKARTNLRGPAPDPSKRINFIDVKLAVDAVRGQAYPYPVPPLCP
jgi:hypothetical protein